MYFLSCSKALEGEWKTHPKPTLSQNHPKATLTLNQNAEKHHPPKLKNDFKTISVSAQPQIPPTASPWNHFQKHLEAERHFRTTMKPFEKPTFSSHWLVWKSFSWWDQTRSWASVSFGFRLWWRAPWETSVRQPRSVQGSAGCSAMMSDCFEMYAGLRYFIVFFFLI